MDFLTTDYTQQIKDMDLRIKNSSDEKDKQRFVELNAKFKKQELIAQQLRSKLSDNSAKKAKKYKDQMYRANETWKLAQLVSFESRTLYDQLYKLKKTKESNPCRDFVL